MRDRLNYCGLTSEQMTSILLERLRVTAQQTLGAYIISRMELSSYENLLGDLVYRLQSDVVAEALTPEEEASARVSFSMPISWFQHLKQSLRSYLPAWFFNRWPVKMKTVTKEYTVKVLATYPMLSTLVPEADPPVVKVFIRDENPLFGSCEIEGSERTVG